MAEVNESDSATWIHAVLRMGMTAAAHPVEYVKVLIQIGYEPFPPRPTKTFFGKPALGLPGVVEYMGFIRKKDGILGLYRGVVPRLCGSVISGYVFGKVVETIEIEPSGEIEPVGVRCSEEKVTEFIKVTSRDMVARCLAIIASQPFQVITIRMIAQFVGKETQYGGIISSFKEILVRDGISGFFVGLVPRILAEVFSLWITSTLTFAVNTYIVEDPNFKEYTSSIMALFASSVTYPFNLISNIMAVNNSGLIAGMPPVMPVYPNWNSCWGHLSSSNQLKRGSSLLWRYYTGPLISSEGLHVTSSADYIPKPKDIPYSSSQSDTGIWKDLSQTKLNPNKGFNILGFTSNIPTEE